MSHFTSPAFTLRRIEYGDHDLIVTFFTRDQGTVSLMAKAAKKSRKRFGGALDLFTLSEIVYTQGKKKGGSRPPVIQEAAVMGQFENIRNSMELTSHASFWAEVIRLWAEENEPQEDLFDLFSHSLEALDQGTEPVKQVHLLFLMRFLHLAGISPRLNHCGPCRSAINGREELFFSNARGGVVCSPCLCPEDKACQVRPGTLKLLDWIGQGDLNQAKRVRFSPQLEKEALEVLEHFLSFQLGTEPRSRRFLRQMEKKQI